jgi:3-isopropylmalate/(R)-2-methylmalate dehydratase small subunit
MFLEGHDLSGATLSALPDIERVEAGHRARHPWMQDVAWRVRARLDKEAP